MSYVVRPVPEWNLYYLHSVVKVFIWFSVFKHPNYSAFDGFPNDIALVKLMNKVDITGNYVRTVCLPSTHDVFDETDYCYISGWGYTMGKNLPFCFMMLMMMIIMVDDDDDDGGWWWW